jgi:hypothetical protein
MNRHSPITTLFSLLAVWLLSPPLALARSGTALTPDTQSLMVSKDIEADRFTIGLNVSQLAPLAVVNVTGNVFRADGGPPSFIFCDVVEQPPGGLADPEGVFVFSCSGTDACTSTADDCAATAWTPIRDVDLPAGFFLPVDGLGDPLDALLGSTPDRSRAQRLVLAIVSLWERILSSPLGEARAATTNRGATLTPDRLSYLINKDVGSDRWSISANVDPASGRIASITGNVYKPDGSAPSFVYCMERDDSRGDVAEPTSEFHFSCFGSDPCESTAIDCAENSWRLINDDIVLSASFLLPPAAPTPTPTPTPTPITLASPTPTPAPTIPKPSTTPPQVAPTPPPAIPTPRPIPPATPTPTPITLASPTPTPAPIPLPQPTVTPHPLVTAPPDFFVPQERCRNGSVDEGEQCDDGSLNLEYGQRGDAIRVYCLFCAKTFPLGYPFVPPPRPCGQGEIRVNDLDFKVCGDDPVGEPMGDSRRCRLTVDGVVSESGCLPASLINGFDGAFQLSCRTEHCFPTKSIRGPCRRRGGPCSLVVDGTSRTGVCQKVLGVASLVCAVEGLGLPPRQTR